MTNPEDYSEQAEIFRQSMVDALAQLDIIADQAQKAYEQAVDDQIAAKDELKRIQQDAATISEAYVEEHRKEIYQKIKEEVLLEITKNMIIDGRAAKDIYKWLKVPEEMMAAAWMELGYTPLGNHVGNVRYINEGRGGVVIFYREDVVLQFPYEFASGNALATVEIPTENNWEKITSLPLEDRIPTLEFIAQRIIRDQAEGYEFEIKDDAIIIKV